MQAVLRGGSSETAQKALTVRPRGCSAQKAVSTTTPLGKLAMTSRKRCGSIMPGRSSHGFSGQRVEPVRFGSLELCHQVVHQVAQLGSSLEVLNLDRGG